MTTLLDVSCVHASSGRDKQDSTWRYHFWTSGLPSELTNINAFFLFFTYKSRLTLYMQTSIVNISPRLISDMLKWFMTQLQSKYAVLFHSYNVSLKVMVRMSLCVIELRLT